MLLWRSSFDEAEWTAFALTLRLRRTRTADGRELRIEHAADPGEPPEPVDVYWVTGSRPEPGTGMIWSRPYAPDVRRKMDVSGGTNDAMMLHVLEPLFELLGAELMTFMGQPDWPATSLAHDLLRIWLLGGVGAPATVLEDRYDYASLFVVQRYSSRNSGLLLLSLLERDVRFLTPEAVASALVGLEPRLDSDDATVAERILPVALTSLLMRPSEGAYDLLLSLAVRAARLLAPTAGQGWRQADDRAWSAWTKVHDHGLARQVYGEDPGHVLLDCDFDALPPALRYHIHRVAALHYPDISLPDPEHTPTP